MIDPRTPDNELNEVDVEGATIHVRGPSGHEVSLTPRAALEFAKKLTDAAVRALLHQAAGPSER
jgi:hypothetical protein